MNVPLYIAKRLYFSDKSNRSSRPAVRVALLGIIIGVMVMIIALCVVVGFKRTVSDKVALFGSHIQLTAFESNNTFELSPINVSDTLIDNLKAIPHVKDVSVFLTKPGIIKTAEQFQGVVLRSTDKRDIEQSLLEGTMPVNPNEVALSLSACRKLRLKTGDDVWLYFVGDDVRVRRWKLTGIYFTGFEDADMLFAWCTHDQIRRLQGWTEQQASGIEITLDDLSHLEEVADAVWYQTANRLDDNGNALYTQTLEDLNPQIFAWLDLLDMNVIVILLLMFAVSAFNIVSGLIILILDSVQLIGTLKALGADNRLVRSIFLYESAMLICKGVGWGTLLGLALAAVQYFTHFLPLDPATYYVTFVPIAFPWLWITLLLIAVVVLSLLVLLLPSGVAANVSPARVMRYE